MLYSEVCHDGMGKVHTEKLATRTVVGAESHQAVCSPGQGGSVLTFQSHGLHLRGLTLITLQLAFGDRRGLPQIEKGTPAANGRFFHLILRPLSMKQKGVYQY